MFDRFLRGEIAYTFATKELLNTFLNTCERRGIFHKSWATMAGFRKDLLTCSTSEELPYYIKFIPATDTLWVSGTWWMEKFPYTGEEAGDGFYYW